MTDKPKEEPVANPHYVPPLKGPGPDYDPRFKPPTKPEEIEEEDPPSPSASPKTPVR